MNFLPVYVIRCYFYFYDVLDIAPLYSTIGIKVFCLSRWKSSPMMRRRTYVLLERGLHMRGNRGISTSSAGLKFGVSMIL